MKFNLIKQQKFLLVSLLFLMAFSLNNCKNSKAVNQGEITQTEKQMVSEGFHKGTIVDYSVEKGCTFLIKKEDTGELLLPYKLEEQFMQDNLEVWFQYQYSRRKQGTCLKGTTITLGEILIRKN